jgi:hypothetical protein
MKKIQLYRIVFLAMLPALVLTSCRFEDEDKFSESPALRIEHQGRDVKNLLVGAPNGWVMQFFCASDVYQFEGFNLFADFENSGKVTMASNHRLLRDGNAGKYTEASSVYEMLNEDGLVLAFNVWNDILTPFSDPVDCGAAPNVIKKDGVGMHGDHNFVVMSYNDNEVILRGERHQAQVRLVKCDRSWQQYISDTETMKNQITNTTINNYYLTNGSETLYFSGLRKGKFLYTDNLDITKQVKADSLACCFTPNGFRLERANNVGASTFQEFTMSPDKTCLVSEDGSVKVIALWDLYLTTHTALWKFDTTLFSAEQQDLLSQMDTEIKKHNSAWSVESIAIGQSSGSNKVQGLVITFYTNTSKTKTNTVGLAMTLINPAFAQFKIESVATDKIDKNMETVTKKATEMTNLARKFAATLAGTYSVVPNDYFLPTGGDFTAIEGGTTFKLQ